MNTNLFKTTVVALALLVAFNSCEKEYDFPYDVVELKLADGAHVGQHMTVGDLINVPQHNHYASFEVYIGKDKDNMKDYDYYSPRGGDDIYLEPLTKYYWYAIGTYYESIKWNEWSEDSFSYTGSNGHETKKTEIRTFYVVDTLDLITSVENGEGEIGAIIHWKDIEHKLTNVKISITPTVECGFAGKTIDVPNEQNSFFIKKSDNVDVPVNLTDFDDEHGINYNPIIYSFQLTADVTIDESVQRVSSNCIKEIFLNKHHHVRDHEFNVYRVVEVGDQYWLADDLRCTSYIDDNGNNIHWEKDKDYMISELPSGAKGILYKAGEMYPANSEYEKLIIDGYHVATSDDWQKLLKNYGVQQDIYDIKDGSETSYYPRATIPDLTGEFHKYDSIADIAYLTSPSLNLWKDIFASASDWVDSTGRSVYPTNSIFNIKPFGFGSSTNKTIKGKGIGAIYYADNKALLISFYYGKEGVGCYPTDWYTFHNTSYGDTQLFLPIRLVKDK